jgi:hypothetical protein
LPYHAHSLPALKKGFPVCGGCSIAATPPPSHKKSQEKWLFFAPLGCLELHEINTNALWLFAHFFRRKPTGFYLKMKHCFLASFQKNRAQNESLSAELVFKCNVPAFLLWFTDKIKMIFFSIERKIGKLNRTFFSTEKELLLTNGMFKT